MQWVLDDSEVATLTWPDAQAITSGAADAEMRLSAARVLTSTDGTGSGQGQWQPLVVTLHSAQMLDGGQPSDVVGRIHAGQVIVDGMQLRSLPLPSKLNAAPDAPLVLELEMAWGSYCRIKALGLTLSTPPQACAVDALQC